jgi:hypothetical protein
LLLNEATLENPNAPLAAKLAILSPDMKSYEPIRQNINSWLGRILVGKGDPKAMPHRSRHLLAVDMGRLIRTVDTIDTLGLLQNDFWFAYGIRSGAVFTQSKVLRAIHEKLGESTTSILADTAPQDTPNIVRAYITALFNHYTKDPTRDAAKVGSIIEKAGKKLGPLDLGPLITIANGVGGDIDAKLRAANTTSESLPRLDETRPLQHVGIALARILYYTTRVGVSADVRALQFEEDMRHVETIEQLLRHAGAETTYSKSDLRLRYPYATPNEISTILKTSLNGARPVYVSTWLHSKYPDPTAAPRGYGIHG